MAAFEWAVHGALTKAERAPLPLAALARLPHDSHHFRLKLQPSLSFAVSRWPVLALWASEGEGNRALARRLSRVALYRRGDKVRAVELKPARFVFWRSLERGSDLDHAAMRALARDSRFNLVGELQALLAEGLVTDICPLNVTEQGGPS
jgi:hypothetical protein